MNHDAAAFFKEQTWYTNMANMANMERLDEYIVTMICLLRYLAKRSFFI